MIKQIKSHLRNHFGFSRAETNGMVILFPIIILTILFPYGLNAVLGSLEQDVIIDQKAAIEWKKEIESQLILTEARKNHSKKTYKKPYKKKKAENFPFNPNKVLPEDLKKLGFSSKTINNWSKYLKSGGRFSNNKDLQKIYGINTARLNELSQFIQFEKADTTQFEKREQFSGKKMFSKIKRKISETNLNLTTEEDLKVISGIGDKLSLRIIKFRDELGGFYHKKQLFEVYGLDSLVIEKIFESFQLKNPELNQIAINTITKEELKKHPYISWKMAEVITNYRAQHGDFNSVKDLMKIKIIDDTTLSKISPYILFEKRSDIFIEK